jgi:hypothetical protein
VSLSSAHGLAAHAGGRKRRRKRGDVVVGIPAVVAEVKRLKRRTGNGLPGVQLLHKERGCVTF